MSSGDIIIALAKLAFSAFSTAMLLCAGGFKARAREKKHVAGTVCDHHFCNAGPKTPEATTEDIRCLGVSLVSRMAWEDDRDGCLCRQSQDHLVRKLFHCLNGMLNMRRRVYLDCGRCFDQAGV